MRGRIKMVGVVLFMTVAGAAAAFGWMMHLVDREVARAVAAGEEPDDPEADF